VGAGHPLWRGRALALLGRTAVQRQNR
jgi:hypothetical protein